ncbi:hypothetical protein MPF19_03805 [Polaribacter sp. Z014]|uniref:hypothetical protein n=1 Tax=Polaribacter sp. Z014 TaxID=2927126 RepID=UPI00201FFAE1|nr:hypothetical protein [Polaribacter sp. Z014]MCL7762527.1 hypothetical protein [Polaribacter sp. Z014]
MSLKITLLSNEQKQEIVSKIKKSNTLKNAPTSSALLQYLHDATLNNTTLKEGVIDIDFFGNKEVTDKNNPRVRVNVYNLRKKLITYYETEGKEDLWRLHIKKGQYKVSFTKTETPPKRVRKINWKVTIPYVILIGVIAFFMISNTTSKPPKLWEEFFKSDSQTNLFIGDHFGITGKTITKGYGWTRDFDINTNEEFHAFIDKNPELKKLIKPSKYSYSTRMGALATQKIQSFFQQHDHNFDIRFSTQTSIPEIKEKNVIYVGPTKNKNQFLPFFNEGNPFCNISNDFITIKNHPKIKDQTIDLKSKTESEEYAIVSKYKSLGNKEHFVFFSQHDIGVSATVAYFTNIDSITKFENTYLKEQHHFTAIFKVKGVNRTDTNIQLLDVIPF